MISYEGKSGNIILQILREEKEAKISGGLYHELQVRMTYHSNHIVTQLFPVPSDCNITANYFLFLLPFRNSSVLFSEARFFLCFN
jgi:hypothetical protein